jgi:hypothetical protein
MAAPTSVKVKTSGLTGEDYLSALSNNARVWYFELRQRAFRVVAGSGPVQCAFCSVDDTDMLTFDHKDDSGAECRRKNGSGAVWLRKVIIGEIDASTLQILCANHNMKRMQESYRQRLLRRSSKPPMFTLEQIRQTASLPAYKAAKELGTSSPTIRRHRALYGLDNTPQDLVES